MKNRPPHPIPYQGSKRNLADSICKLFPEEIETLYEPFAGSAAITLYAAKNSLAKRFVIGDKLPELVELWRLIIDNPEKTALRYEEIWTGHINGGSDYFNKVRDSFNHGRDPVELLYLMARCVKNAVRFNKDGKFTQSADKRRLGTQPEKVKKSIREASILLRGRTELYCGNYTETISQAGKGDLVYLDPPYHGTTYGKDKRYFAQIERDALVEGLHDLNNKNIHFLLSYDGMTGGVEYGEPLPDDLEMYRLLLNAGRSSQATLNGKNELTLESLYVSRGLIKNIQPERNIAIKQNIFKLDSLESSKSSISEVLAL